MGINPLIYVTIIAMFSTTPHAAKSDQDRSNGYTCHQYEKSSCLNQSKKLYITVSGKKIIIDDPWDPCETMEKEDISRENKYHCFDEVRKISCDMCFTIIWDDYNTKTSRLNKQMTSGISHSSYLVYSYAEVIVCMIIWNAVLFITYVFFLSVLHK